MARPELPSGVPIRYRQLYRRCGKDGCSRCAGDGRGHGPYWYASWWAQGRRHDRYLGKEAPVPAPPALRVQTLGGFAVWRGATPLAAEQWTSRRALALFQCLLSVPGHRLHREQVMEWLWPEADPGAAATNLRTTLHLLRTILGDATAGARYVRTRGPLLELVPDASAGGEAALADWLDAEAFAQAAGAALAGCDVGACRAALALYGGEYLPAEPYAAWAEPVRGALRQRHRNLLRHLAHLCGAQGAVEESEQCLRQLLAAEPTDEDAAATLMALLAASGRRPQALRVYQALAVALEEVVGVPPTTELTALRARLLAQETAPRASALPAPVAPGQPTNLPLALTSFVGRVWEMAEISTLLALNRLVTLTGPGGCGKTRLALEVAARQVGSYAQGVWLVDLSGLAAPTLVLPAVAAALGVAEQPGQPLGETLGTFLQSRRVLLVLDNCEHLLETCAGLVARLLATCPRLQILTTSREVLGVPGEQTYRVPSLAVPDPAHLPPLEQLRAYEAVHLFLERAQAHDPALRLTAATAGAIAAICARLDGLPLAIELAAARVSTLSVASMAARLDDRLRVLTGGPRTVLPRQQTLRATIDWSYELLTAGERRLFARLAVFAGGCDLEAAEAVCAPEGTLDVLAGVESLLEKSLLRREGGAAGEPRFAMLETVREYALERLEASGEAAALYQGRAAHYLRLVERAAPDLWDGPQRAAWFARLEAERDNLRAVLSWSVAAGEAELGLRLASALAPFWGFQQHLREGVRWMEQLLALDAQGAAPPRLRAIALLRAGWLAQYDRTPTTRLWLEDGLALARVAGEQEDVAFGLIFLGDAVRDAGDRQRAQSLYEEGVAAARATGNPGLLVTALMHVADMLLEHGDRAGVAHLDAALAVTRSYAGGEGFRAWVLTHLARYASLDGAYARARALLEDGMALAQETGDRIALLYATLSLGAVLALQGEATQARATCEQAVLQARAYEDRGLLAFALAHLGDAMIGQGDLAGAHAALEESVGLSRALGVTRSEADALVGLGVVAYAAGAVEQAVALQTAALAHYRDEGLQPGIREALPHLGAAMAAQGRDAEAGALFAEGLGLAWGAGDRRLVALGLEGLAEVAARRGDDPAQAARWLGAAEAIRRTIGAPLPLYRAATYRRTTMAVRRALGADAWGRAWAVGQGQTAAEAVAAAMPTAGQRRTAG